MRAMEVGLIRLNMANIEAPHRAVFANFRDTFIVSLGSRHIPAIVASVIGLAISFLVSLETAEFYAKKAEIEFRTLAAARSATLGKALDRDLAILQSLGGFYAASQHVDRDEFRIFAEHIYPMASGIRALEWIPRIPAAERADYEEAARTDGYADFRITEADSDGDMVSAGGRAEYFPVYFLEPYFGNERALGFDLGSNAARLEALEFARDTGETAVTAAIRLVQDTESQPGFLAFSPIYGTGAVPETMERRRSELTGFALGVFSVDDIVTEALQGAAAPAALDTYLFDTSAVQGRRFLHFQPSESLGAPGEPLPDGEIHEGLFFAEQVFVGNRQWSLIFKPASGYFGGAGRLQQWGALSIGLLLTLLLAQHLVTSGNRTAVVEGLVAEKTAGLVAANRQLESEIAERRRIDAELARSNAELEQFASVASHDLQEPLRKVQAFGGRLKESYADRLDDRGRDYLSRMGQSTARMQTLINELLSYSRVKTTGGRFEPTDLSGVIKDVLADLEVPIQETGGRIIVGDMPKITADAVQMRQLFQNLIGNALKYRRADVSPIIRIAAELAEDDSGALPRIDGPVCRIQISDNGIGFEQQYEERIFGMFQRLHGRGAYEGVGIGLAICLRIVERHGGRIRAEGRPGEGAAVTIELPGTQRQPGAPAT